MKNLLSDLLCSSEKRISPVYMWMVAILGWWFQFGSLESAILLLWGLLCSGDVSDPSWTMKQDIDRVNPEIISFAEISTLVVLAISIQRNSYYYWWPSRGQTLSKLFQIILSTTQDYTSPIVRKGKVRSKRLNNLSNIIQLLSSIERLESKILLTRLFCYIGCLSFICRFWVI